MRLLLIGLQGCGVAASYVESKAIRIEKEAATLLEIGAPFIAYIENDFALVYQINQDEVKYTWRQKKITLPLKEFLLIWSGVLLVAEGDEKSIEPDYLLHRRKEWLDMGKNIILFIAILFVLTTTALKQSILVKPGILLSLSINTAGAYLSYLLLLKQLHIYSHSADNICSLFSPKGNCNTILDTEAAKFMGIFSWSEIGLGYFTANLLILVFLPALYPYAAIINLLALPYTVWSIWYQATVAKQWCVLCVLVQGILWLLFFNNYLFKLFIPLLNFYPDMALTTAIYIIPVLLLNRLTPLLVTKQKLTVVTQQSNCLKAQEVVFTALQSEQPYYPIDKNIGLLWGNLEAKNRITVITNPHCHPCANLHKQLEKLLQDTHDGYCIQYILASFNEELEESSRLLIAMYQHLNRSDFLIFLNQWYTEGKYKYKEFYRKYPFNTKDESLQKEYRKQKEWLKKLPIRKTPTILFNERILTDKYNVEDLALLSLK